MVMIVVMTIMMTPVSIATQAKKGQAGVCWGISIAAISIAAVGRVTFYVADTTHYWHWTSAIGVRVISHTGTEGNSAKSCPG